MRPFRMLLSAFLAGATMLPAAANALILRADFSGTASAQQTLPFAPRPPEYYDGQPVTGFFEVDVVEPLHYQVGGDDYVYYLNLNGSQHFSYTVRDQTFDFHNTPTITPTADPFSGDPSVLLMTSSAGGQSISFMSNIFPKYDGAVFRISGPAGSLFDDLDPTTLRLAPGASYSTDFVSGAALMRFDIGFDSLNVRILSPVPEPPIALLLLAGGVALAWQQRRRSSRLAAPAL